MLQQVCEEVHNYFIKASHENSYEIADGMISPLPDLKEGQRFMIAGSDLNDGIYTYHASGIMNDDDEEAAQLADEVYSGSICALSIPKAFAALAVDITEWVNKYGESVNSPYQSENVIGVYSYTKADAKGANGEAVPFSWKQTYRDQLKRWRKVSF